MIGLYLGYFRLELSSELVGCTLELIQRLTQLDVQSPATSSARKASGQAEDERHFGESQIHMLMILPNRDQRQLEGKFASRNCLARFRDEKPQLSSSSRRQVLMQALVPNHGWTGSSPQQRNCRLSRDRASKKKRSRHLFPGTRSYGFRGADL